MTDRTKDKITIGKSKLEWDKLNDKQIENRVEKDSWIALKQYFDGKGNASEAKIAVFVLGILAKKQQAMNNKRQLDIVEQRLLK